MWGQEPGAWCWWGPEGTPWALPVGCGHACRVRFSSNILRRWYGSMRMQRVVHELQGVLHAAPAGGHVSLVFPFAQGNTACLYAAKWGWFDELEAWVERLRLPAKVLNVMNKGGETVLGHVLMFGASGLLTKQRSGALATKLTGLGALVSLPAFQVRGSARKREKPWEGPGRDMFKEAAVHAIDGGRGPFLVWCAVGTAILGRWGRGKCRAAAGRPWIGSAATVQSGQVPADELAGRLFFMPPRVRPAGARPAAVPGRFRG